MTLTQPIHNRYITLLFGIALITLLLLPSIAQAAVAPTTQPDPLGDRLCTILSLFLGKTSQAIAIIGIFTTGLGALSGKLQWTTCLVVVAGLIMMFLAPQLVMMIMGGNMDVTQCVTPASPATPSN